MIINVHGATASMSGGMDAFFQAHNDHVLFNFVDATQLSLANIGVQGSIVAPFADITTGWGVIWGQVAAASWNGPMQVNSVYYDGYQPPLSGTAVGDIPISEPTGAFVLAIGLFAFAALRRRDAVAPVRAR